MIMVKPTSLLLLAVIAILPIPSIAVGITTLVEVATFMEEKSKEKGVVATPSGLMFKEIRPGKDNGMTPTHFEQCTMRWHNGTLADRVTKPSNLNVPDKVIIMKRPSELIPGWAEAVQRTKEGAMLEVYIPPYLGYRHTSQDVGIPEDAVFVITFELLKVHRGGGTDEL